MRCGTANAEITIHSADIPEPLNFKDCFKPGVGQNIDRIPVHASPILRYAAFLTFVFFPQTASVVAVLFLFPVCVCVCVCVCGYFCFVCCCFGFFSGSLLAFNVS